MNWPRIMESINKVARSYTKYPLINMFTMIKQPDTELERTLRNKYNTSLCNHFKYSATGAHTSQAFISQLVCVNILQQRVNRVLPIHPYVHAIKRAFFYFNHSLYAKLVDGFQNLKNLEQQRVPVQTDDITSTRLANSLTTFEKSQLINTWDNLADRDDISAKINAIAHFDQAMFAFLRNHVVQSLSCFNYSTLFYRMDRDRLDNLLHLFLGLQFNQRLYYSNLDMFELIYQNLILRGASLATKAELERFLDAIALVLKDNALLRRHFVTIERILVELMDKEWPKLRHIFLRDCIKSISFNFNFYMLNFPAQTEHLIYRAYECACKILTSASGEDMSRTGYSQMEYNTSLTKEISKMGTFHFDNRKLDLAEFSRSLDVYLSYFCGVSSSVEQSTKASGDPKHKRLKLELCEFKNVVFSYAVRLKHVARLARLSNVYNAELFAGVLGECVRIAEIFCDTLFVTNLSDDNSETLVFSKKFILELLTAFGLFDYFDYKHLFVGDAKRIEDMARSMSKLRAINAKLFEHVKCDEYLIQYQFGLMNLDMDFEAVNGCFLTSAKKILENFDFDYAKLASLAFKFDAVSCCFFFFLGYFHL
jgi:hypothetical protein